MNGFFDELRGCTEPDKLEEFCLRKMLHGTPHVFAGREEEFFTFRRRISQHFRIHYNEIIITGSAKLGFSPLKRKYFDYDSDIDIAIVSPRLFEKYLDRVTDYQYEFRENPTAVSEREIERYHRFL